MSLYLVQHALSLPKETDPEKGISEVGRADAERIAAVAKGYHVKVNKIRHSGKKRAQQTAEIFGSMLKPEKGIEKSSGLDPLDDVADFAKSLHPSADDMIVSHLPFLGRLTSWLIIGKTDQSLFEFQNGGIVCLDKAPKSGHWHIKWTLMPNIG